MTQLGYLEKAVQLKKANPKAKIHFCVASDEFVDGFTWMGQLIYKVELGWWYDTESDRIYTELDDVIDHMETYLEREVTEEEALSNMEPAILIYTEP